MKIEPKLYGNYTISKIDDENGIEYIYIQPNDWETHARQLVIKELELLEKSLPAGWLQRYLSNQSHFWFCVDEIPFTF